MSRASFKHWANQFGGYHAKCTRCDTITFLFEDAAMAEDWWAMHVVSTQHAEKTRRSA